jgi:hypothetical protein
LYAEGKLDSCAAAVDKLMEILPKAPAPLQYKVFDFRFVDLYYRCGKKEKATALATLVYNDIVQNLDYYKQFSGKKMNMYTEDVQQGIAILNELARLAGQNNDAKASDMYSKKSSEYQQAFAGIFGQN